MLLDAYITTELSPDGAVFRTDRGDAAGATSPNKVGVDADGKSDGCDNEHRPLTELTAHRSLSSALRVKGAVSGVRDSSVHALLDSLETSVRRRTLR